MQAEAPLRLVLLAAAWLLPSILPAAEWYAQPLVTAEVGYNTNPRLSRQIDNDVLIGIAQLSADLGVRTPTSKLELKPRLRSSRYQGDEELNSDDQFLDLLSSHRTLLSQWELKAGYARDTTQTSELEDSGLVQNAIRRVRWDVEPSLAHDLSENNSLGLALSFRDVSYERRPGTRLFDYTNAFLRASLSHDLRETDRLSAKIVMARFDVPELSSDTESYAVLAEIRHDFSQTMRGTLEAGLRSSERSFDENGESQQFSDTGGVFDMTLAQELQLTGWEFRLSHIPWASGRGFLLQRDQLMFEIHRSMAPLLSGRVRIRLIHDEPLEARIGARDRDFARMEAALRWRPARQWTVHARYRYTWQELEDSQDDARANELMFSIDYAGPRMSVSR